MHAAECKMIVRNVHLQAVCLGDGLYSISMVRNRIFIATDIQDGGLVCFKQC